MIKRRAQPEFIFWVIIDKGMNIEKLQDGRGLKGSYFITVDRPIGNFGRWVLKNALKGNAPSLESTGLNNLDEKLLNE